MSVTDTQKIDSETLDEIRAEFELCDLDNNGRMDLDEFYNFIRRLTPEASDEVEGKDAKLTPIALDEDALAPLLRSFGRAPVETVQGRAASPCALRSARLGDATVRFDDAVCLPGPEVPDLTLVLRAKVLDIE